MYEMSLLILKFAARSSDGVVRWVNADCQCSELQIGGRQFLAEKPFQVDLAKTAIFQPISLGLLRREFACFQITNSGRTFAEAFDLPEQAS